VIEWADRLGALMPREHLKVELRGRTGDLRSLRFYASGARYLHLLEDILLQVKGTSAR
jgi:tRNA A37 threonylcarbamoyladenosine biosynthesis protein TsaE